MLSDFRLKVFLAVATEKSFSRAAYSLGISQPAVSQKISSLEAELGTPLFSRTHGDISLTEKGQVLLPYAKRLIAIDEAAVAALSSESESRPDALPLLKELFRYLENFEGKESLRETIEKLMA